MLTLILVQLVQFAMAVLLDLLVLLAHYELVLFTQLIQHELIPSFTQARLTQLVQLILITRFIMMVLHPLHAQQIQVEQFNCNFTFIPGSHGWVGIMRNLASQS